MKASPLQPEVCRFFFPAFRQKFGGVVPVFLDAASRTQVPEMVIHSLASSLWNGVSSVGASFRTSRKAEKVLRDAGEAAADLLGASGPEGIRFGISRASAAHGLAEAWGRRLRPDDEVLLVGLDSDAPQAQPWQALEKSGVLLRRLDAHPETGAVDLDRFGELLGGRTRLLVLDLASESTGTLHPAQEMIRRAREAGAGTVADVSLVAAHRPLDVQALGCDWLICAAELLFGPVLGILWGRPSSWSELGEPRLEAPETGSLAGLTSAIDYLEELGEPFELEAPPQDRGDLLKPLRSGWSDLTPTRQDTERHFDRALRDLAGPAYPERRRREKLLASFESLRIYEEELARHLLESLAELPGLQLFGGADPERVAERLPIFTLGLAGEEPSALASRLARKEIYCRAEARGIRVALVHTNTLEEIDRLASALREPTA